MDAQVTKIRPITIAIVALGGEGGGVLADWIVDLAQHGGYLAQATSVPGVAQRTGATIYYVELFPKAAAQAAGRAPVLALMPVPGDVDIVLASELMEAARAVERGLAAFGAGFEAAQSGGAAVAPAASIGHGTRAAPRAVRDLLDAAARDFTGDARAIVLVAIERLVDYQDKSYARQFLARLARFQDIERQHGDGSGALLAETARQLALAMTYEDTIRVAELKIRS